MPPKHQTRRRHRGRQNPLHQKIQTLKEEMCTQETGRFAAKSSIITMPPFVLNARMYCTVRLQNNNGLSMTLVTIKDIMVAIQPAFQNIRLVSATVYGPFITTSGSLASARDDYIHLIRAVSECRY